jgi:DNA-binding CsgD family transcriptional regulator
MRRSISGLRPFGVDTMVMLGGSTRTLGKILPSQELPSKELMDLLGQLYETLLREDRWPDVLSHMAEMFEAADAAFLEWNEEFSAVRYFVSGRQAHTLEAEALFRNHYALVDPAVAIGRQAPVGGAANCIDVFKPELVERNEYYQGFLLPRDLRYRIAIKIRGEPESAAFLFLYRRPSQGPFGVEHMRLLAHLDSHLRRLAQLHAEVRKLKSDRQEVADILDRQTTAFVTVDRNGQARTVNRAASKLLLAQDGLALQGGNVEAIRPEVTRKLKALVALACAPAPTGQSSSIWLARREGKPALVCIVSPGRISATGPTYAILAIADPLTSPPMTGRHLVDLYGLTSAEARLACDLVEGRSVDDIADQHGVAVSTIRTQLSATLKKCEVERQVDLVRLLCRLPSLGRTA